MSEPTETAESFERDWKAPPAPKSLVRISINGDEDKIAELSAIIANTDGLHPGLKAFLTDEIAALKSNAASVHLHLVDRTDDGGGDLHVSWRAKHHGRRVMAQGVPVAPKPV